MVKGRIVGQACVKCFRYDFNHSVNFTLTATLMSVPFKSEWWVFLWCRPVLEKVVHSAEACYFHSSHNDIMSVNAEVKEQFCCLYSCS